MKRRLFAGIPVFIMVALLAAGCGGSDGSEQNEDADTDAAADSPAEVEELVERGLSISAPAEGALLSGNFTVTFTWSELPDRITVMLDSDVIGTLTAEPMQLDVDSTGHGDGPHTLTATGAWGDDEVEAGPVSVIVDNEGPVIDASAYLTYAIVSGEQALIPVDIIDAAGLARIEIFRGTEPLTTVTADPFLPAFDSTAFDDSVLAMMLRVTDLSGRSVVSDEIPVTVMNRGSIVESLEATDPGSEWDTWSIDIPAEPTDVDLHLKNHWNMPAGIARILTVAVVESEGEWMTEYSIGEGGCPHSGTVRRADFGSRGVHIITYEATNLGVETFEEGVMWFAHMAQGSLTSHLGETFTYRNTIILIPDE
jgi:hypothetical protein